MLTRSASAVERDEPEIAITRTVVPMVTRNGVPQRGWITADACGSRPSRLIAKPIRPMPTRSTRMTEVRPATAAMETSVAAQFAPTALKAEAIGAPSSILS